MLIQIAPFVPADRAAWESLARGYKAFYETSVTDAEYATVWQRLLAQDEVYGLGAKVDGELLGITHFLFHSNTWMPRVCYLQDLFVSPRARGQGLARMLIEAVAQEALKQDAGRCYWLTQQDNHVARLLYDKLAKFHGFIRYDFSLETLGKSGR